MKQKKQGIASFPALLILLSCGIVLGVSLYVFDPFKPYFKRQDAMRKNDLKKIAIALEFYYRDFGLYPDFNDETFTILVRDKNYRWGDDWKPYMGRLPKDPAFYKRYAYWSDRRNKFQSYKLYSALDRPDLDKNSCHVSGCPHMVSQEMCGKYAPCNYAVTSGNISP